MNNMAQNPYAGYDQGYFPSQGYGGGYNYDPLLQGTMAMQSLPGLLSGNALTANALSSANMQAAFEPQAQVALGQLQLQQEQLRQNAMNQRFGPLMQLLAGVMGNMRGGSSGFQGFSSGFGQGAHMGGH